MSSRAGDSPKPSTSNATTMPTTQFAEVVQRIGPPPDLSSRFYAKYRYGIKQRKYLHAVKVQHDLKLELAEKHGKEQRLQDEIDLLLDQLYAKEYAHLQPAKENLFSDDDGDDADETHRDDQPEQSAAQSRKRPLNEESEAHEAKRHKA